jgi:hypothetical protein
MIGYVRIHRTLFGHAAFRNESETMAFAWLIGKAAWRPTRVRYKGHSISLKRGQLAISQRDMAAAFDRDKAWIERLWKRLKSEAMIETSAEAGVAVITICNYDEYQNDAADREASGEARREAGNEADVRQRRGTEQEREKGKKEEQQSRARPREATLPADVQAVMEAGGFISPPPDLGMLRGWYAEGKRLFDQDAKATLDQDILPIVRREAQALDRKGYGRPRTLQVFDAPIREKFAADAAHIEHLRKVARRNQDQAATG